MVNAAQPNSVEGIKNRILAARQRAEEESPSLTVAQLLERIVSGHQAHHDWQPFHALREDLVSQEYLAQLPRATLEDRPIGDVENLARRKAEQTVDSMLRNRLGFSLDAAEIDLIYTLNVLAATGGPKPQEWVPWLEERVVRFAVGGRAALDLRCRLRTLLERQPEEMITGSNRILYVLSRAFGGQREVDTIGTHLFGNLLRSIEKVVGKQRFDFPGFDRDDRVQHATIGLIERLHEEARHAASVTSDPFLVFWTMAADAAKGKSRGSLLRGMKNDVLDHVRYLLRRKRDITGDDPLEPAQESVFGSSKPEAGQVDTTQDSEAKAIEADQVKRLLAPLTPREQAVALMLIEGYEQEEIAANLGMSQPRVSQLKSQIKKKIAQIAP